MGAPLEVPEKVRRNAALMGDIGHAWLAELPQRITELEDRWAITIGQPARRGSEAFVAEARTSDGHDVVVKILIPGFDPERHEMCVLRQAQGVGYARLIRCDEISNTMLLEKLGPPLHEYHLPEETKINSLCATLREAWMAAPESLVLATGAEKAAELSQVIEAYWDSLGRPCSRFTMELALSYAERRKRAFDPELAVLAHGDAHEWNALAAPRSTTGFKFIDPDGAFAEPAFDLGVPMREWGNVMPESDPVQLGYRRCRLLSQCTGVEFQPIWEWGLLQCVSNGLLLLRIGLENPAAVEFAMATAWAAAEPAPSLGA
jgi:streptomycin 6-kinase